MIILLLQVSTDGCSTYDMYWQTEPQGPDYNVSLTLTIHFNPLVYISSRVLHMYRDLPITAILWYIEPHNYYYYSSPFLLALVNILLILHFCTINCKYLVCLCYGVG